MLITKKNKQDVYEIIPEEISFEKPNPQPPSHYMYNYIKYQADLERERIDPFEDVLSHNGKVYYKNPFPYYGPTATFKKIPQVNDVKFQTPVVVAELENTEDKKAIEKELQEREKELANRLLFINLPKKLKEIKQNDFLPYYDPTSDDRIIKINRLRDRIIQLRHYLNIENEDVSLYVEVKNNTFPRNPIDIVNHLNESYSYVDTFKGNSSNVTNGKFSKVKDIYNERNTHLSKQSENHDEDNILNTLKDLYSDDVIDPSTKRGDSRKGLRSFSNDHQSEKNVGNENKSQRKTQAGSDISNIKNTQSFTRNSQLHEYSSSKNNLDDSNFNNENAKIDTPESNNNQPTNSMNDFANEEINSIY